MSYKHLFTDKQEIEICDLYFKNKMNQRQIAKQVGCCQSTVGRITKRKGYKARNHLGQCGEHNPNWRGGRWVKVHKYIMVYNPSHPYCDCRGYMQEHRLVMEKHLGRFLTQQEVTHHMNGDIQDNRIENLRLFSCSVDHLDWHKRERQETRSLQKDFR